MADTLAVLRDALRARDRVRKQIDQLESQSPSEPGNAEKRTAQRARLNTQVSRIDADISELRGVLSREIESSRSVVS